jgi:hypothetical protein
VWHGVSGDSAVVSLPYPHADVALYRDWWIDERNRLLAAGDLDDLTAGGSSYLLEAGVLTLRLEVQPDRPWAVIDICRHAGCP